jgi:hypothetical protein
MTGDAQDKPRKKLNRQERRRLQQAELLIFVKQWGRKAQKRSEPNDRSYDRAVERRIKRMKPERLDDLIRDDSGGED